MDKRKIRLRRAKKTRGRIARLGVQRLCIHKTPNHLYVQAISPCGSRVLVSASTVDKAIRSQLGYGGNIEAAAVVGKLFAERAKKAGLSKLAFDRSGFKYHGRIKAFADAAREHSMEF